MRTPLTPLEFMRRARRIYADREAVVADDLRFTYEQLGARTDAWASALQQLGVNQGDRVACISPNTHALLESFYSVPQLGAVLVPINYRLIAEDFAYIINHSGAKVVCASADHLEAVDSIRDRIPEVTHFVAHSGARDGWLDYERTLAAASGVVKTATIAEDDLLTLNYTSGTTARPKGVMITHRNAYMNTVGTLIHVHMTREDRYLWTLPMFHANGWTFTWTVTAVGGTHVCLPKVDVERIFKLVNDERITMLCAAPTVLIGIANAPAEQRRDVRSGVRVLTAGAPPAAATIERIEGDFNWEITHVYGLTETAPFITVCEPPTGIEKLSLGERAMFKARQGIELVTSGELLVVDAEGNEVRHDGATSGEIIVRGNVVMEGYYNDPEATANAFRGGYFHSGDAAVVHPDGYVEIRDRIKDIIISGGENISSVEVESALLRHTAIQEVAVVGIPDERWGEVPHAFVILRTGRNATEDELRTFARDAMAHFKVPQRFHIVDQLPKTATGKIQKFVLRGNRSAINAQ
jgi:fatty-acyl-CoA synthase